MKPELQTGSCESFGYIMSETWLRYRVQSDFQKERLQQDF